ncbi:PQQ-like beta-propeller repeat protein [Salipiger sp. P9]|uniref:PQQ-like beta-propeller repeat protein n=1 Tax=Salipiger pentaromativorans TaxID=2943193 RepID=UPI002157B080|nr:PQQ-like beta-propeller repeat protein [Salipiger pentaromativorans]MCR8547012.1 PQQ-like beta-propeller repeat protein [Salipiger pentaromativorans]
MRITTITAGLLGLTMLSACEDPEVILPGERYGTREVLQGDVPAEAPPENSARALALAAAQSNADWAQSPVSPFVRVGNAALGRSLTPVLSVNIGEGDTRRERLNVDPVVAGGRIFTMDSQHRVSAVSPAGAILWQKSMVPDRDAAQQAQGGGLAAADGRLYVASGFGRLTALDAATGDEIWTQRLGGTATGAPTASGGLVYVTSGDNRGWAIEADSGRVRWQTEGVEDIHNVAGAPAPALSDDIVIFGYGSGSLQAAFRQGGLRRWSADVVGARNGIALAGITDLTGAPVIAGNRVFAGNHSGRVVAFNLDSGERLWTALMGARGPVWPAGDSVFLVSDVNELVRLDAATGGQIWAVPLPGYVEVRRPQRKRSTAYAHHGPVMAGGRLVLASSDGLLRSFNPEDGALLSAVEIPNGATTAPAVAGGTLYVVTKKGQLVGYR